MRPAFRLTSVRPSPSNPPELPVQRLNGTTDAVDVRQSEVKYSPFAMTEDEIIEEARLLAELNADEPGPCEEELAVLEGDTP